MKLTASNKKVAHSRPIKKQTENGNSETPTRDRRSARIRLRLNDRQKRAPSAHAHTIVRREHQAHCAHPAVGITSTEPGGLARPRKTICKLKRFVTDLERTTDILCQWYALIAALSRIALAAAIVRIILIGGDVPVCKTCMNCGHRTHRDHRCPDHQCAHCGEQGHIKRFCPDVQCPSALRSFWSREQEELQT